MIAALRPAGLLLIAAGGLLADAPPPLRILRTLPGAEAGAAATVEVTFDRPVAGSLDRTVDPRPLLRVSPAVAGVTDWRDPVTLRFRPAAPLTPGTTYTVTVAAGVTAMDGSRLAEEARFTFRVRGPRVLAGHPVGAGAQPMLLEPEQRFLLVTDVPPAPDALRAVAVQFGAACARPGVLRLAVARIRPLAETDDWTLREAGGWDRDRALDSLRRVVELRPERPLPLDCAGDLLVPDRLDAAAGAPQRWPFRTYGPLRLQEARCGWGDACPLGPAMLEFSTPVRGAEVQRHVTLDGAPAVVRDTTAARARWALEGTYAPRRAYRVRIAPALRDVFGQAIGGAREATVATTGYTPAVDYAPGRQLVERLGFGTLAVTHVNIDTLEATIVAVPESLEARVLARDWDWDDWWAPLSAGAARQRIAVTGGADRVRVHGVRLPGPDERRGGGTLLAVQVSSPRLDSVARARRPIALVQVTDLAVHARVGVTEGAVWVTGVGDGRPRAGVAVRLRDATGRSVATARTDSAGLARLAGYGPPPSGGEEDGGDEASRATSFTGSVEAVLGADRAVVPVREWDPDLSPWRFGARAGWGAERLPAAGAVFTERGIYRPGETVYAKAIARRGALGRLGAMRATDTLRWRVTDRDGEPLREALARLTPYGTAELALPLGREAPLGQYGVQLQLRQSGAWVTIGDAGFRVAEYRPPEFLVDVAAAGPAARVAGDTVRADVEARYLFGAPMARAAVQWSARRETLDPWALELPGADGWQVGETGWWWEDDRSGARSETVASGTDTLDARGRLAVRVPAGDAPRAARLVVEATVTDVNRQQVSGRASVVVHPAEVYVAARPAGASWFWRAGEAADVDLLALAPDGRRVAGVALRGALVRREWHQVRRERDGYGELVGEWVSDTVERCVVRSGAAPARCRFTPPRGGSYVVAFEAADARGRVTRTSFYRWAVGSDWVPWNDETQFKMDVIADRARYAPGDTATILFASPFTDAEAWVTVEREGLIEQRRLRITSGTTTLRLPVTEALAPNAFVSILVARGRSAAPGPLDDPGRPTLRVGYAELRVTPERKRLAVQVTPARAEYRPGDSAEVRLLVRDAAGRGARAEVALWAVDEGVLSLTGFRTPDPLDLLYRPRGLGLRLASNLSAVAPQVPEGEKGRREPGGGGGGAGSDLLRSRFQTTAFFLGAVETDAAGRAVARARLPDNLTTFRVMAVAVTAGDRFGSGEAPLLVTRPLLARPALPRFVRGGDAFAAGVVVNQRAGGTPRVEVTATAEGLARSGAATRAATLERGRGREVRFDWSAPAAAPDSVRLRFDVRGAGDRDAVAARLPVRGVAHAQAITVAGALADTQTAVLDLPAGLDPAASTLTLSVGGSPLAAIRGAARALSLYPYGCSEQLASGLLPVLALLRAERALGGTRLVTETQRAAAARMVATLAARQRSDGGIGLWSATAWTTPWLSAYAGAALAEAREAGLAVPDSTLPRLARYLRASFAESGIAVTPVADWARDPAAVLAEQVMAVETLARLGARDRARENELLRRAPQLAWEDRLRLARALQRAGDAPAARRLLQAAWQQVTVEGRRAVLPVEARRDFYIPSSVRPAALLLEATAAAEPGHPLIGPLVQTLLATMRDGTSRWNTQDLATAAAALASVEARRAAGGERTVRVLHRGRVVATAVSGRALATDTTLALASLGVADSAARVPLLLVAERGELPVYYDLSARLVAAGPATRPVERGLRVERWYERLEDGRPVTQVAAGELVRVRLRVTAPAQRSFVAVDDPLPAGLEAVDLSLRIAGGFGTLGAIDSSGTEGEAAAPRWSYGSWEAGWWSPFDHRELRDDRVVYVATLLWPGTYTATYVARATTAGTFIRPPAHAEEMYNPAVFGESDGGTFTVTPAGGAR